MFASQRQTKAAIYFIVDLIESIRRTNEKPTKHNRTLVLACQNQLGDHMLNFSFGQRNEKANQQQTIEHIKWFAIFIEKTIQKIRNIFDSLRCLHVEKLQIQSTIELVDLMRKIYRQQFWVFLQNKMMNCSTANWTIALVWDDFTDDSPLRTSTICVAHACTARKCTVDCAQQPLAVTKSKHLENVTSFQERQKVQLKWTVNEQETKCRTWQSRQMN